jgi:hypothetical protein
MPSSACSDQEYAPLYDPENAAKLPRKGKWQSLQRGLSKAFPVLAAILVTGTLSIAISNHYHLFTHSFTTNHALKNPFTSNAPALPKPPSPTWTNCGSDPATARARGCSFDLLSFAWQTRECFDSALISAFLAHSDWTYYTDTSGMRKVPASVAVLGETDLYVSWDFHVKHCTYLWRQMHRAFALRGFIDSHLDNWGHTMHCQVVLLDRVIKSDVVNVKAAVRYPECRPVVVGDMGFPGGPTDEMGELATFEHHSGHQSSGHNSGHNSGHSSGHHFGHNLE